MFLDLKFNQTNNLKESFEFVLENYRGIIGEEVQLTTKDGNKIILGCTFSAYSHKP